MQARPVSWEPTPSFFLRLLSSRNCGGGLQGAMWAAPRYLYSRAGHQVCRADSLKAVNSGEPLVSSRERWQLWNISEILLLLVPQGQSWNDCYRAIVLLFICPMPVSHILNYLRDVDFGRLFNLPVPQWEMQVTVQSLDLSHSICSISICYLLVVLSVAFKTYLQTLWK